jgi:hypothetical protein
MRDVYILAIIGKIDTEVHEVISAEARLIDDLLQHSLVDLVGDIAKHNLKRHEIFIL